MASVALIARWQPCMVRLNMNQQGVQHDSRPLHHNIFNEHYGSQRSIDANVKSLR